MQMTDSQWIAAPRAAVWAALNDPEVLRACIPGCESLEMVSPTEMTAKVTLKVGPVKATFGGKVTLSDIDAPNGYRISGEGSGGVAGFAKGGATIALAEDGPNATILTYAVDAQIGGKLAQLGAGLIDPPAKMMADQFFAKFSAVAAERAVAAAGPVAAPASAEPGESAVEQRVEEVVETVIEYAGGAARAVSGAAAKAAEGLDRVAEPAGRAAGDFAGATDRALDQASRASGLPKWVWIVGGLALVAILLKPVF